MQTDITAAIVRDAKGKARLHNFTIEGLGEGFAYQVKTAKGYMYLATMYGDNPSPLLPLADATSVTMPDGTTLTKGYKFNSTGLVNQSVEAPSPVTVKSAAPIEASELSQTDIERLAAAIVALQPAAPVTRGRKR